MFNVRVLKKISNFFQKKSQNILFSLKISYNQIKIICNQIFMNTMIINQSNILENMQKILKLVSKWKELEIKIKDDKEVKINIQESYKQALKDYEEWNFSTRFIKKIK